MAQKSNDTAPKASGKVLIYNYSQVLKQYVTHVCSCT
jgi:hypothetical protein